MPRQRPIAAAPARTRPGPGAAAGTGAGGETGDDAEVQPAPSTTSLNMESSELDDAEFMTSDRYPQSAYNQGTWTAEDDGNLLRGRAMGHHWAELQRTYFPTKTANACRKRYERLVERRGVYDYDARRFERIATEYMAMRRHMWTPLADRLGERWDIVEGQCMAAGLRTIQSSSRSHTNRWRREAKISQKAARQAQEAAASAAAGVKHDTRAPQSSRPPPPPPPPPHLIMAPTRTTTTTTAATAAATMSASNMNTNYARNMGMMPPPPRLIPSMQPAPPPFTACAAPAIPFEPILAPVEPGGFLGQLEDAGWRDDEYRFDDVGRSRY